MWNVGAIVADVKSRASDPVRATADSVKSAAVAVPPLSLITFLTSLSFGAASELVIVQVASPPTASVMLAPACEPPTQFQSLAV